MPFALLAALCLTAHRQPPSPVGRWRVDHYELRGSTMHCYECPIILFRPDGTGQARPPSGQALPFAWKQRGAALQLRAPQGIYPFLPNGTYQVAVSTDRKGERTLTLARGAEFRCVFAAE